MFGRTVTLVVRTVSGLRDGRCEASDSDAFAIVEWKCRWVSMLLLMIVW